MNRLNPQFKEEMNNSFVLDCPAMDLFTKNGISVAVKDWDRGIGGNDELGSVDIAPEILYEFGEEAREFKLNPPKGKSDNAGFVTLRCTQISSSERDARKKGGFFSKIGAKKDLSRGEVSLIDMERN